MLIFRYFEFCWLPRTATVYLLSYLTLLALLRITSCCNTRHYFACFMLLMQNLSIFATMMTSSDAYLIERTGLVEWLLGQHLDRLTACFQNMGVSGSKTPPNRAFPCLSM